MKTAPLLALLALAIVTGSIIIGMLFPVELMFSVEPRYWYVIYKAGSILQTQSTPLYIVMWRIASLLFLSWLSTIIIYIIKPLTVADALSVVLGLAFTLFNYIYLFTIGIPITFYPFIMIFKTIGQPLIYVDMGQVMIVYIAWRLLSLRRRGLLYIVFGSGPKGRHK